MDKKAWMQWRSKGIGASDTPIILGVSPWKTRKELWEEKTGLVKKEYKSNWAIDRGNRLEPLARTHYELMVNFDSPPCFVQHYKYSFIRASLDGFNKSHDIILEIKCPGKKDHENAMNGLVPMKYYPQIQHQLFVTGSKKCHYFSFDGHNGCIVEVEPDTAYMASMLVYLIDFWDCVLTQKEPSQKIEMVQPRISIGF